MQQNDRLMNILINQQDDRLMDRRNMQQKAELVDILISQQDDRLMDRQNIQQNDRLMNILISQQDDRLMDSRNMQQKAKLVDILISQQDDRHNERGDSQLVVREYVNPYVRHVDYSHAESMGINIDMLLNAEGYINLYGDGVLEDIVDSLCDKYIDTLSADVDFSYHLDIRVNNIIHKLTHHREHGERDVMNKWLDYILTVYWIPFDELDAGDYIDVVDSMLDDAIVCGDIDSITDDDEYNNYVQGIVAIVNGNANRYKLCYCNNIL